MITRKVGNKTYKLEFSTEKKVGMILMAIMQIDAKTIRRKRPRIKRKNSIEAHLKLEIKEFKKRKQLAVWTIH